MKIRQYEWQSAIFVRSIGIHNYRILKWIWQILYSYEISRTELHPKSIKNIFFHGKAVWITFFTILKIKEAHNILFRNIPGSFYNFLPKQLKYVFYILNVINVINVREIFGTGKLNISKWTIKRSFVKSIFFAKQELEI